MTTGAIVENCVIIIGAVVIVIFVPGWWKLMAIALLMFVNSVKSKEGV